MQPVNVRKIKETDSDNPNKNLCNKPHNNPNSPNNENVRVTMRELLAPRSRGKCCEATDQIAQRLAHETRLGVGTYISAGGQVCAKV